MIQYLCTTLQYDSPSPSRVRSGEHHTAGGFSSGSGDYRRSGEVIIGSHSPHYSREQTPQQPGTSLYTYRVLFC